MAVDDAVHRWFVISSDGDVRRFFAQLGNVTGPAVLPWAVGVVVFILLVLRRWLDALYLAVVTAGCGVMIYALKLYFARARPEIAEEVLRETTYSFPSGHSAIAVAVFGSVAYLLVRGSAIRAAWPSSPHSRRRR